ncbi:hypothetical protein [Corynebacterium durum]|uniref:hypothetical protein n=1 Tax=Corynebacterium durum TaxID=61592 RepID=UPI00389ADBB7
MTWATLRPSCPKVARDTLFGIGAPAERIHNWLASSDTFLDPAAEATFLPP